MHDELFDPFDKRINLSAYDRVDGDITDKIKVVENNVDSSIPGKYQVTYEVKNSVNNLKADAKICTLRAKNFLGLQRSKNLLS